MPPLLALNFRSEVSTAPVLLLIFTLVLPEIVIAEVNVILPTTLIWAFVAIALESSENVDTLWLDGHGRVGTGLGTGLGAGLEVGRGELLGCELLGCELGAAVE